MGNFEVDGKKYTSEDLTASQKNLLAKLSFVKQITNENRAKNITLIRYKAALSEELKKILGEKIIEVKLVNDNEIVVLANGSEKLVSSLDSATKNQLAVLSSINGYILESTNILEVLDTAKLTYSKEFYADIK